MKAFFPIYKIRRFMGSLEIGAQIQVKDPQGKPIGLYTVRGQRGHGGQGYIYTLAAQDDGKPAVLKVPSPKGVIGSQIERRILEALPAHPNIVHYFGTTTIDTVECCVLAWGHESPFLRLNSSELVEVTKPFRGMGAPRVALPATTAVEMIQEVLSALEHLHMQGYVHGDIKPGNVLIEIGTQRTRLTNQEYFSHIQQRSYRTLLIDFGTTRSTSYLESLNDKDKALVPPEFTPLYAPPELIPGVGSGKSGPPCDVYMAGLLLYEWVTGNVPYDHVLPDSARGGLSADLLAVKKDELARIRRPFDAEKVRQARQHDVVFAEAFAAQRLRDLFYDGVLKLIDTATSPDPAARPTIAQLRAELIRMFELERPMNSENPANVVVSSWNPRWHLTRTNRFSEAARVPDKVAPEPQQPGELTERPGVGSSSGRYPRTPMPQTGQFGTPTTGAFSQPTTGNFGQPTTANFGQPTTANFGQPTTASFGMPATNQYPPPGAVPPPATPRAPATSSIPAPASGPNQPGPRIALVDDDKVTLTIVANTLRKRGYRVRTFGDPESALEVLSRDHPDAAIFDMQMPVMTGIELTKRIVKRASGPPFPILILSSETDEQTLSESYKIGVTDYLVKPVAESELVVKLEQALSRSNDRLKTEPLPRELAGLELLDEVRRGELAVVFRAASPLAPRDVRYVKVLRPDLAGEIEPLLKLRREIDAISRCFHPGIVRLLASGVCGRLLYYVSDNVPRKTLGELCRERGGKLGEPEILALIRAVASALEHLHERMIAHTDITPESVGVTDDGAPVVMELGNARWLGGVPRDDEPAPLATRYAAPEILAVPSRPSPASDLYSLGVVALETFTGRPVNRSASGVIDVRAIAPQLTPILAAILARLVARSPEERFVSATALMDTLAPLVGAV